MNYHIYFDRPSRCWWAYWLDANGNQVGDAVFAADKSMCLIYLGMERGNLK